MKKIKVNFSIEKSDTPELKKEKLEKLALKLSEELEIGLYEMVIQKPQRTNAQNRALHLFCHQVSAELNGVGATCRVGSILKEKDIESDWNQRLVKELIWRPVQKAMLGKDSTTSLKTDELDRVAKPIMEALASKFDIGLVFPSQLSKHLEKESKNI